MKIDIVDDTHNGNKILQQCSILQLQVATITAKVKVKDSKPFSRIET